MSELSHDAFVHLDLPALAQISRVAERPSSFGRGRAVLDCDHRSYGRNRVVWRNGHAPDSNPALTGEQSQFGTALPIHSGDDGCECCVRLVLGVSDQNCVHGGWGEGYRSDREQISITFL